jgi:predicted Fe-Mo cluster-binding NifX family protein
MKIAIACDDQGALSTHFGRSAYFELFEVANGKLVGPSTRRERHECGEASHGHHGPSDALPDDCKVVLCGGMGSGAAGNFSSQGIQPIVVKNTSLRPVEVVEAFLAGHLEQGTIHSCCHNQGTHHHH